MNSIELMLKCYQLLLNNFSILDKLSYKAKKRSRNSFLMVMKWILSKLVEYSLQ